MAPFNSCQSVSLSPSLRSRVNSAKDLRLQRSALEPTLEREAEREPT